MDVDAPTPALHEVNETVYLRGALDSTGAVIYTVDRSLRIMTVNAAWDDFAVQNGAAHLQAGAVVGTNLLDWIGEPHRRQAEQACLAIFRGALPQFEYDFDCSSPEQRRVCTLVISPLRDADGEIVGATFISYDITRRKLLEEEAQERNAELQRLIEELRRQHAAAERERDRAQALARLAGEHAAQLTATIGAMADGVWMCDATGRLIEVNDAGLRMFGLRKEDVVGASIDVLSNRIICRSERPHLGLRTALSGQTIRQECDVDVDGVPPDLIVELCATPILDAQGAITGAVTVVRDITRAKAMDRMKEDFLSVAAHELKTPITALKGYAQLALKRIGDLPEAGPARRFLETIDGQADRITSLVQKLLDVSRIHAGKLELQPSHFDLQDLIEPVVNHMRLISPGHTIEFMKDEPVVLVADMQRIEQVLFNLLDNAVKYSPDGGTIRLRVEIEEQRACVTVTDQGLGIPQEKLPHIFERWYQAHFDTHGDYGGMGLGLYICKEIVEQHGGYMWAHSYGQGGSSIGFALPLSPPSRGRADAADS
jgi:PAS domain S-box-containing protein